MPSCQVDDTAQVSLVDSVTRRFIVNCSRLAVGEIRGGNSDKCDFIDLLQPNSVYGKWGKAITYDNIPSGRDVSRDAEAFVQYASLIASALEKGKKAVVFCKNGRSRSPCVIAAFYIIYRGLSLREIKEWFAKLYPMQRPVTARFSSTSPFPNIEKFENVLNLLGGCLADPEKTVNGFNLAASVAKCSKANGIELNLAGYIKLDYVNSYSLPPGLRELLYRPVLTDHQSHILLMTHGTTRQDKQFSIKEEIAGEDTMPVKMTTVNSAKKTLVAEEQTKLDEEVPRKKTSMKTSIRKEKDVLAETVVFAEIDNISDTSSFGADLAGEQGDDEKVVEPTEKKSPEGKRTAPDADGLTDWAEMWKIMQDQGWTWINGDSHPAIVDGSVEEVPAILPPEEEVSEDTVGALEGDVGNVDFEVDVEDSPGDGDTIWNRRAKRRNLKTRYSGSGLVDWYYVHPNFAHLSKKSEIMKAGKEGEDYFVNEESVMRYAKIHLGFRGRVEMPVRNNDDQKRGRKRTAAGAATAEPIAPTKNERKRNYKSQKKQADKPAMARKKLDCESKVNKTKILMNSNWNEDSDDDSCSSGGEEGSGLDSPSFSEADGRTNKISKVGKKRAGYKRGKQVEKISKVGKKQAAKPKQQKDTGLFWVSNAVDRCSSSVSFRLLGVDIDTEIAPNQFCDRLCLIKTSNTTESSFTSRKAGADQPVSVNKLWPALKFDTFNDLMDQLNKMETDRKVIAKTKGRFVFAARKSLSNADMTLAESGFAYLLGKGTLSEKSLVPLAKNDSGELIEDGVIFDFFDAVIEMETAEGYCASPEFQNAFKNAMARIELEESGENAMQVNVTTVNSAKKTMAEEQPMQGVRKEASRRTSPRKKQAVPVETVEFTGNPSDTSSFGADLAGEQVDPAEKKSPKGKLTTSDADGLTDWNEMWKIMQDQGWTWVVGDGLVDWYYVHPKIAHLSKKTEIMKAGKEGEDYFISDESVMRYAKIHLGFRGRVETPVRNNDDQRRGRKRSAAVVATTEPIAPTKKEKKRNSKSKKKQADKTSKARKKLDGESKGKKTKIMMNSNRNEDVDDESHFSEGGKAFGPNSPSMSEAEANLGEQSAQKKLTYHSKQHNSTPETAEESSSSEIDYTETESESDGAETEISESDDNTFQVMSSTDAWKLLMDHFGFKYHKGMYCLPGSENKPGNESCAIEGRHYFSTLMELRKHLCAYGLPKCKKYLEYEGTMAISRWVRFAHVQGLADGAFVNPADLGGYLNFREAWTMLQKVGLTWSNGLYVVDGGNPLKEPRKFEQQEDMCVHLARFGIPQIPSSANIDLTEDDRLRLDLFLTGAKIDTLKRIDPDKENVNEITPRRSRSKRSSDAAESCKDAEGLLELSPKEHKQALGHRVYQTAFNSLEEKRQIDLSQIDAEKCKRLLVEYYNFSESTSYDPASAHYGDSYFCFPGVAPTEKFKLGVDFFESVQDMREYLCAYGLPPRAKRSRITDNEMAELEQWIRTAHMMSYDEYITTSSRMQPREVKNILKGLGYQFSRRFDFYLLPDTPCHKSQVGRDRFEQLIDLFNHIARFGLSSSEDGGVSSVAEMQRVQLFIASVATNDLSQQVDCREPLPNQKPITLVKTPSVAAKQSELDYNASEVEVKTPKHVPVVLDQDDTPESKHETPRKQNGILNYFAKTVADGVTSVVKAALTPSKNHSVQSNIEVNTSSQRYSNNELAESESNASRLENTPPPSVEETAMDEDAAMRGQDPAQLYNKKKDAYSLSRSQIHLPWVELWKEMRSGGWRYEPGNDLVGYYYVHSHCAGMKKREVLRGKKGMDYFESEEEVQEFAKKHLGWKGEKVFSTPGETMMSSPVITSSTKRQRTLSQEEPSPSKKSRTARQHSGAKTLTTSPTPYIKAQSPANSKQNSTSSQASEPKKNLIPLPDQQLSYKDKLEYCKLTLHPSYKPKTERLASTSNSVVEQLEHEIKQFMKRAINTGYNIDGMSAPSPGFMYICGGPGTGKTTAVTACSQLLAKWSKEMGTAKPCYCQINMASNASKSTSEIQKEMLKDMAKKLEIDKKSPQDEFMSQFSKKGMILVVDEIDMLFKNRGGSGEEWFSTLIEWCEDEDLAFSMIGISNSVNDASAKKIRELGNSPHELVFPTYNEADLLAILKKRIGVKIVDIKALQLISKRVAASTGDARKVLEITSNAVDKALDACKEKWSDEVKDDCYPLVKLPQMMRAIREGMPTRHEEIIRGLPQAAKVILCIAVSLGKVWGPTAAISIAALKKYAVQATKRAMLDDASLGQISNVVEMLMDSGLLTTDHDGCFNFNAKDLSSRLHIGVQLDDVEIALEKTLLEESSFYRSLVDYVKREHPHPE